MSPELQYLNMKAILTLYSSLASLKHENLAVVTPSAPPTWEWSSYCSNLSTAERYRFNSGGGNFIVNQQPWDLQL